MLVLPIVWSVVSEDDRARSYFGLITPNVLDIVSNYRVVGDKLATLSAAAATAAMAGGKRPRRGGAGSFEVGAMGAMGGVPAWGTGEPVSVPVSVETTLLQPAFMLMMKGSANATATTTSGNSSSSSSGNSRSSSGTGSGSSSSGGGSGGSSSSRASSSRAVAASKQTHTQPSVVVDGGDGVDGAIAMIAGGMRPTTRAPGRVAVSVAAPTGASSGAAGVTGRGRKSARKGAPS